MQTTARSPLTGNPWIPLLVAALALPIFVSFWIGGRPQVGAIWACIMVVFAIVVAVGGRSDTIRLLRGDGEDERTLALEFQASAVTAVVLIAALACLFLAAGIRGESGLVYGVLLLLAEATHLGALAVLNRRS